MAGFLSEAHYGGKKNSFAGMSYLQNSLCVNIWGVKVGIAFGIISRVGLKSLWKCKLVIT